MVHEYSYINSSPTPPKQSQKLCRSWFSVEIQVYNLYQVSVMISTNLSLIHKHFPLSF